MSIPKVIVFDLYGTLVDPGSVLKGAPRLLPDPDAVLRLWRSKQLEYTWQRSLMGRYRGFDDLTRHALDYALSFHGARIKPSVAARIARAFLAAAPYPDVPRALARLSRRVRLVVFSNGTRHMIECSLRNSGLRQFFQAVVSVDPARIYKPSPQAYRLVTDRLRISRGEVLFVSSNYWDAAGAQNFGLPSCWVNRREAPEDSLGVAPRWTVRDLGGVVLLIDRRYRKREAIRRSARRD